MAFLVADVDDFLVAAPDDFLVTADDTVPGVATGFDNVNIGPTAATWARIGSVDLSKARVGSFVIWEEIVVPTVAPAVALLDVSGFVPTITAIGSVSVQPGSATMAASGLAPTLVIANPAAIVTYMAPGCLALTSPSGDAALPFASINHSFVFDF